MYDSLSLIRLLESFQQKFESIQCNAALAIARALIRALGLESLLDRRQHKKFGLFRKS